MIPYELLSMTINTLATLLDILFITFSIIFILKLTLKDAYTSLFLKCFVTLFHLIGINSGNNFYIIILDFITLIPLFYVAYAGRSIFISYNQLTIRAGDKVNFRGRNVTYNCRCSNKDLNKVCTYTVEETYVEGLDTFVKLNDLPKLYSSTWFRKIE